MLLVTISNAFLFQCDLVLDAAHRKKSESSSREVGPKREDIVESIIFKSADIVLLHFKDVDLNYARRGIDFLKLLFNNVKVI